MADIVIERWDRRKHHRGAFCSGKPQLDDFLRTLISQYEKRNLGRTFVAVRSGEPNILGYYALAAGAVRLDSMPKGLAKKLPRHPIPVIRITRLAVDQSQQGKGLGAKLLLDAFVRILELANTLGVFAVVVDALDDPAKTFYEKYGFIPLADNERCLFLPLESFPKIVT